jgi:hypothetical protein
MLKSKLVFALGLAGLVAGGAAMAAQTAPVPAANIFLVGGSTALDNQFKEAILLDGVTGQICQSNSATVYTDAPTTAPTANIKKAHQTVITCNLNAALGGLAAGAAVAFVKESNGGSNEGTAAVANGTALAFYNPALAITGCAAGIVVPAAGQGYAHAMGYTEFDACTGPSVTTAPTIGLADETPPVFNLGTQAITSAAIAKLTTTNLFQNQFAIAVSLKQYRALQAAQGKVANSDLLADVPTLTTSQIAGVLSGLNTTWDQVDSALANTPVFICRRGLSSGTNVSAEIYFLQQRCSNGHNVIAPATTTTANCGGLPAGQNVENFGCKWAAVNLTDAVFAGTGGGDVDSCLHAHDVANQNAIGILGATQPFDDLNGVGGSPAVGAHQWRYIAINGHKPTVLGMANGTYDYAFDNVMNLLTTATNPVLGVSTQLANLLQNPTVLSDIWTTQIGDANYKVGGLQDSAVGVRPAVPVTVATLTTNPTSAFTQQPAGIVDSCQTPLPFGVSLSREAL